jgi:hypothetical protein
VNRRNEEFAQIIHELEMNHTDFDILNQFHHLFFMGDLAYRIVTDRFFAVLSVSACAV